MVGIIVAVKEELEAIEEYLKDSTIQHKYDIDFSLGRIKKTDCVIALCGVGKVNAARTTQLMIDEFQPDYIINLGVAGGISERVKIGDVVVGEKLVQHDFDLTAFGREKGEVSNKVGKFINCDKKLVKKAIKQLDNDDSINGVLGIIASGDIFVTDINMSKKIYSKFDADCCEMEGAAIAQVCFLDEVPFIVVRSISDSPNDNNKIDFEKFIEMASSNIAKFVVGFLK